MAIVIKEIILSDNLEKFMEKVNFNFDQLLLAGGGPPGPIGPIGLVGPGGPKGDPGNKWYVGPSADETGVGPTLFQGDLFLSSGDGGNTAGITGEVYEWNNTGNQFDDTLLNLIGPIGPQGLPGSNLGWNAYGGATVFSVYMPFDLGVLGATANFHFLKGDTSDIVGTTGVSLDTLWLGGLTDAQASTSIYPLENLPKIFIAPRTQFNSEDPANAGFANSGIALGKDSGTGNINDASPDSFSNIFIDTNMNLRITNFTNFGAAAGTPIINDIFIESFNNVTLIGGGYYGGTANGISASTIASSQIGASLTGITGWNANPVGIINISDGGAQQVIQNELGTSDLFRIIGGGAGGHVSGLDGGDPSVQLHSSTKTTDATGYYSISIAGRDVTDFTATGASYGRIIAGYNTANYQGGVKDWIGLASDDGTTNSATLIAIDHKIHIGNLSNISDGDNSLSNMGEYSLNVTDQIRMGYTEGTAGQIIVSEDQYGKMKWDDPSAAGIPTQDSAIQYEVTWWSGPTTISGASGMAGAYQMQWFNGDFGQGLKIKDTTEAEGLLLRCYNSSGNAEWGNTSKTTVFATPGSTNHTLDANSRFVEIVCVAGGGGGGQGSARHINSPNEFGLGGAGGGAGGYSIRKFDTQSMISAVGTFIAVEVGAGGTVDCKNLGGINSDGLDGFAGGTSQVKTNSAVPAGVSNVILLSKGGGGGQGGKQGINWQTNLGINQLLTVAGGAAGLGTVSESPTLINSINIGTVGSARYGMIPATYFGPSNIFEGGGGGGWFMSSAPDYINGGFLDWDTTFSLVSGVSDGCYTLARPSGGGAGGGLLLPGGGAIQLDPGTGGQVVTLGLTNPGSTAIISGGVAGNDGVIPVWGLTQETGVLSTGGAGGARGLTSSAGGGDGGAGIFGSGGGGGGAQVSADTPIANGCGGQGGAGYVVIIEHF